MGNVFHEGSHFIIDKVYNLLAQYFEAKKAKNIRRQTWHNLLFYTTGRVVSEAYARQGITFTPYYKEARFEDRVSFKLSTDAFTLYWDPLILGEAITEKALERLLTI